MLVLIPAYEPCDSLVTLVAELLAHPSRPSVLVVDDGSGPDFDEAFALAVHAGAKLVRYATNHGKGHALKVGLAVAEDCFDDDVVVCADSDGQHSVADIMRVAAACDDPGGFVLGARRFTGRVPLRSRVGNQVTTAVFRAVTGQRVSDTQTGLRAYPRALLSWLRTVPGERFEYELSLLLRAKEAGVAIREVPIETIYLHGNASSHFRPIRDSWRVYQPLLAFSGASLIGFAVDWVLLFALMAATSNLLVSAVIARLVSASANYLINRHVTFGRGDRTSSWRYAAVALGVFAANYLLLALLDLALPLAMAKLVTEVALFSVSFAVQRSFVFRSPARPISQRMPVRAG